MSSASLYNKWRLDLGSSSAKVAIRGELSPPGYGAIRGELSPPGYGGNLGSAAHSESSSNRNEQREQQQHLLSKRAWELALGPIKGLPMNVFMMYMAGSTISIFPIMMVAMMAWRPIKAFMTLQATFKPLQADWTGSLILHKLVYALGNLAGIALAVYKCHSMGLLPTHASDWLDFVEPARYMHSSFVSVVYS